MKRNWEVDFQNKIATYQEDKKILKIEFKIERIDDGYDLKVKKEIENNINPLEISKLMSLLGDEIMLFEKDNLGELK